MKHTGNNLCTNSGNCSLWTFAIHPLFSLCFTRLPLLQQHLFVKYHMQTPTSWALRQYICFSNIYTQETNYSNMTMCDPWRITIKTQGALEVSETTTKKCEAKFTSALRYDMSHLDVCNFLFSAAVHSNCCFMLYLGPKSWNSVDKCNQFRVSQFYVSVPILQLQEMCNRWAESSFKTERNQSLRTTDENEGRPSQQYWDIGALWCGAFEKVPAIDFMHTGLKTSKGQRRFP